MWQTLVRAAIAGTDRQLLTFPQVQDEIDRLLAQLDTANPAKALLDAAALLYFVRQAGRVPTVVDGDAIPPSLADDAPVCSPQAARCLQRMLAGEFPELLPEWLSTAATAGWRVPPELLPEMLDWGNRNPQWRGQILPVVGNRGRWLAAQNPEWQYAEAAIARSIWETGTIAMRLWTLQRLRDRDPAEAREWVAATWNQDKAPDRAAFLAIFKTGLTAADKLLLELAIDDKSKQVRAVAADLLARLPDSQLTQRAIDRITPIIHIQTQPQLQLEVKPPQTCDDRAIRDGILVQPPAGMGQKAWWLVQMLGQVPPSLWTGTSVGAKHWGDRFETQFEMHDANASPDLPENPMRLLQAAVSGEWYAALLEGWAIAAERHGDIEWAEALLPAISVFPGNGNHWSDLSLKLMEILPIDRREALVWNILRDDAGERLKKNHPLLFFLKVCRHPWSLDLSLAVIDRVAIEIATSADNYNWSVRSIVRDCAYFLNPSALEAAERSLGSAAKAESYWEQTVDEFLEILQFRHEMLTGLEW
ncbi:MAG TPA: hypothetical protein IGS17_12775 [Oscillatoriales cyanobacterium M59_W2019_021]|nr:hypothetical protein [Oscillatoriales cyanobacterium M4454_W2019_049]HIK51777.1 hypothetical protein [Oscillatoriales cyanobacterium M59_W2019_021]